MFRIVYNETDGSIVGCFSRADATEPLQGQLTVDLELTDNQWDDIFFHKIVNGSLVMFSAEERAEKENTANLKELRIQRDQLLADTDVWVLPDRNPTQEQLDYRQALRDITLTFSSVTDEGFAWPEKP